MKIIVICLISLFLLSACGDNKEERCREDAQAVGAEYISVMKTNRGFAGEQQYACWVRVDDEIVNLWED